MSTIHDILGELYTIDPSLRDHEAELIPVIEAMMRSKPNVTPNPAFVEHLRMTLRERVNNPKNSKFLKLNSTFFSFLSMNSLRYTFAGLFVGVLVAAPLTYSLMHESPAASHKDSTQKLFTYSVEGTSSNAFGDLSVSTPAPANQQAGAGTPPTAPSPAAAIKARPQSGGGGPAIMQGATDGRMIPNPEITQYHLTFDGAFPAIPDSVDVYKKIHKSSSTDFTKVLTAFDGGLIDLSSFKGAKVDSITFYQNTAYGYMGTVSLRDGTVSLNQNWDQWPHPENACQDQTCYEKYQLKIGDVPSDDTVISIAQAFVKDHGVDLTQYGQPEVDHQWRTDYDAATDKSIAYIPDTIRVIYPLMVEGKAVYDENGVKSGISIGINVREKKVSDAWGIGDQEYQKSAYTAATSVAVQDYLGKFGQFPTGNIPTGMKITDVTVTLGTPVLSLVHMNRYHDNTDDELLVPALVFPVTSVSGGISFYAPTVTVPLAAELLKEQATNGGGIAMPLPMPMMQEGGRAEGNQ